MNEERGNALDHKNEPIIRSLMNRIEINEAAIEEFKKSFHGHLLERMNREPEGERREQMVEDFETFDRLFREHFEQSMPLTDSVGAGEKDAKEPRLHKQTNAVAVYVVEGTGYDQFGDQVQVQLTRREIHPLDIRTKNGMALLEGIVQLNQKIVTDDMIKGQHIKAKQAYAYTQVVPVLNRGDRDA